jgi:large exoprotein involved in heme utilization and adhesion
MIEAKQISLDKGSIINSDTFASGQGGNININATESISILGQRKGILLVSGTNKQDNASQLTSDSYGGKSGRLIITTRFLNLAGGLVATNNFGLYKSSDITINADKIDIKNGGVIASMAFKEGDGGEINIHTNTMSIIGRRSGLLIISVGAFENNQSSIATISFGKGDAGNISIVANDLMMDDRAGISAGTAGEGHAGDVIVNVKNLFLGAGSEINSSSGGLIGEKIFIGQGPGGDVHVIATDSLTISGQDNRGLPSAISTNSLSIGQGGNVNVESNHLNINDGGAITASAMGTGNAGNVVVQANTIEITNSGTITTSAEHATGGNITIVIPNLLYLQAGKITTSVGSGEGGGGDITIENPAFVVLNQGKIKAQADEGQGGDIYIKSEQFLRSNNSLVSASSRLGIDGDIKIDSPAVDLSGALLVLSSNFDVDESFDEPCEAAQAGNSFVVKPISGVPPTPSDWKANLLILLPVSEENTPSTIKDKGKTAGQLPEKVALLTGCQPEKIHRGGKKSRVMSEKPLF